MTRPIVDIAVAKADMMRVATQIEGFTTAAAGAHGRAVKFQVVKNHIVEATARAQLDHTAARRGGKRHRLPRIPGNDRGRGPAPAPIGDGPGHGIDGFVILPASYVEGIAGREHLEAFIDGTEWLHLGARVGVRAVGGDVVGGGVGHMWEQDAPGQKRGEHGCGEHEPIHHLHSHKIPRRGLPILSAEECEVGPTAQQHFPLV